MRLLWVDASAGAAGDMILGALVDLGLPVTRLRRALERLALDGWTLRSRRVLRSGLSGRRIDVRVRDGGPGRGWSELRRILGSAELPAPVRDRALGIFRRLIEAEAAVHGQPPERIHLHEAGGTDAVIDVVGACVGLHELGVERIVVSPMTTGWGTVRCAHGRYPVPGPATLELVRGCAVRAGDLEVERLTPTGAAILTAVADAWGPLPPMKPLAVGYGAGLRELESDPNMLRLVLGTAEPERAAIDEAALGEVLVLECTVDDVAPQTLAHACRRLLREGALEVFTTAVTMKKGRSGHALTILARPEQLETLSRTVLEETGTLGLRFRLERRIELHRSVERVRTRWGEVRVKRGLLGGRELHVRPEFEDCAAIAAEHGLTLREVRRAALEAYRAVTSAGRGSRRSGTARRKKPTAKRRQRKS